MKQFLLFCAIVLSFLSAQAQTQPTNTDIQKLIQRVDSLEKELTYFKLTTGLAQTNSDINIKVNNITITTNEIEAHIYRKDFDRRFYDMYLELYYANINNLNSTKELIEVRKQEAFLRIIVGNFNDSETSLIRKHIDAIESSLECLEIANKRLKAVLEIYHNFL